MTSTKGLLCIIYIICVCSLIHAEDESRVKDNGKVVYKYTDLEGMEWEYEHRKEKVQGEANLKDVIVFNGPWKPNKRSNANSLTGSGLLVTLLVHFII